MKTVYLCGPIGGYDLAERAAYFQSYAERLRLVRYRVLNPFDVHNGGTLREIMRADLTALLDADGVALLDHPETSRGGVQIELALARYVGIPILPVAHLLALAGDDGRGPVAKVPGSGVPTKKCICCCSQPRFLTKGPECGFNGPDGMMNFPPGSNRC